MSEAKVRNDLRKKKMFSYKETVNKAFAELTEAGYARRVLMDVEGPQRSSSVPALQLHPLLVKVKAAEIRTEGDQE